MWLRAEGKTAFENNTRPEWVQDWLKRRRSGGDSDKSESNEGQGRGAKSIALTAIEPPMEVDPKAEARAAPSRIANPR